MEIFRLHKPDSTSTKKAEWISVFDAEISRTNKHGKQFKYKQQKPKVKINGKWVEK